MAKSTLTGLPLACAALAGALALTSAGTVLAQASRVGVTSATNGDPLGKPPSENERVLRIGIDVQANEVVTTHDNDRAHLVFLDGTSLTVGPNAQLTIDKFVYDPNTKTGDLAMTATTGVFRLVGGKISKTNTVTINTPSGTIGIRGGIGIFTIGRGRTIASFIFGHNMTVTGGGQTQNVTRPGSQVIVNSGAPPSLPTLLPPGGLSAAITQLETGNSGPGNGGVGQADTRAASSGFTGTNTGGPPTPPGGSPPPGGPNPNNNSTNQAITNSGGGSNPDGNTKPAPAPPPPPDPIPKTTQTLKGFVGGLVLQGSRGTSDTTTQVPLAATAKAGDLTLSTDASTSTAQATIIVRNIDRTLTSPTLKLPIGVQANSSFFQDDQTYISGATAGQGTSTPLIGRQTNVTHDTTLYSSATIPSSAAPYVGTGSCACEFLTFGEWQTTVTSGNKTYTVTQAPWVAGTLAVQLPNTGSASFSGIMLGQAQNSGGLIRNVTGSYGMNYSWGAGIGSFNASFDTKNYAGAVVGTGNANFTGAFAGGGNVGSLAGAFYSSPTAAVAGQAGTFGITGSGYAASGIFAGAKN
jgi:FecR protein